LIAEFRDFVPTRKNPAEFIDKELAPYAEAYGEITTQSFSSFKHADAINRQLVKLLVAIKAGDDLFLDGSPLQLDDKERQAVRATLAGDIYTVTRIRLPLLLRLDELLSAGSAIYSHAVISVEHVLPQNPSAGSQWLVDFPDEALREAWVHKLGNLVLLTRRKNAQASNYDFTEKKTKYFSTKGGVSNFALTSKVLSEATWTPNTLKQKQAEITGALEALWRLN
jgi:hypothetical protein